MQISTKPLMHAIKHRVRNTNSVHYCFRRNLHLKRDIYQESPIFTPHALEFFLETNERQ